MSRQRAKRLGLTSYFTGMPCKRGHISQRSTSRADCLECRKQRQQGYMVAHPRKPHPLTIARLKSAEARRIAHSLGQRRYSTGRPCSNGHISERRVADGMCVVCASKYSKRYYTAHRKQQCRKARDYQKRTVGYDAFARARQKARRFGQIVKPGIEERKQMIRLYGKAHALTILTGKRHDVDHIVPLSAGGLHVLSNLQVGTHAQNMRKESLRRQRIKQAAVTA